MCHPSSICRLNFLCWVPQDVFGPYSMLSLLLLADIHSVHTLLWNVAVSFQYCHWNVSLSITVSCAWIFSGVIDIRAWFILKSKVWLRRRAGYCLTKCTDFSIFIHHCVFSLKQTCHLLARSLSLPHTLNIYMCTNCIQIHKQSDW